MALALTLGREEVVCPTCNCSGLNRRADGPCGRCRGEGTLVRRPATSRRRASEPYHELSPEQRQARRMLQRIRQRRG